MRTYFDLFRIKHWIKNLIVFFPAFFGGVLFNQSNLFQLSISFFYFSLAASTVYLFNDLIDYNQDKLHPKKKERPISSGKISVRNSIIILIVMYITLILGSFIIDESVIVITIIYVFMNILYTLFIKEIPIIELFIVAIGFVLRILLGAFTVQVVPSKWIIIVAFFIALYLIVTKRRGEFLNTNFSTRKVLKQYNIEFLNSLMYITLTLSLISYLMYTLEVNVSERYHSDYIYITTIFVVLILLRHLQQTIVYNKTESPIQYFYTDKINFIAIIGFLTTFYFLIY